MDAGQTLLKYWGYKSFRPLQEDIVHSILKGNDTLALMPTGGGKSICFQIPALVMEGVCIVVSPLIALMQDQLEDLSRRNIKSAAIYSGMKNREIDIILDNCIYGKIKLLYISPERIKTKIFMERYKKMQVNLIAVDEAHCISQWGHDFRPSYLDISNLRSTHPNVPVLALTATATKEVIKDINVQLEFKESNTLSKSFERKNISYAVLHEEDKTDRLLKILNKVPGSSIVYVRTRRRTKEIANFLSKSGISTDFYHAGLSNEERLKKQNSWNSNTTRVIVSTNAFGMGINKPDVRSVIHVDPPNTLESYFQEAGRAGRNDQRAYAVLLLGPSDRLELERQLIGRFPDIDIIKKVYLGIANFLQIPTGSGLNESYSFDIVAFCKNYDLDISAVFSSIKFLEKESYLVLSETNYNPSRIKLEINKESLYEFQVKNNKFDSFIKTLLRSYQGLFENFVQIDEFTLSKRLNATKDQIIRGLQYLEKLNVITYIQRTTLPQLTFLTPRLDASNIRISNEHYKQRKEVAVKKMESVIYFASTKHKCRSEILLEYFGEKNSYRCGTCDVCLERNKLELSDIEFSTVSNQIKKILQNEHLPITQLINKIEGTRDDKTIKVVQWLIENNKIKRNQENLLEWKK